MTTVPGRDEDGQPVTDRALAVPDAPRSPAAFTPE